MISEARKATRVTVETAAMAVENSGEFDVGQEKDILPCDKMGKIGREGQSGPWRAY